MEYTDLCVVKKVKSNSLYELHILTSYHRVQHGSKEKEDLYSGNLTEFHLNQVAKANINNDEPC